MNWKKKWFKTEIGIKVSAAAPSEILSLCFDKMEKKFRGFPLKEFVWDKDCMFDRLIDRGAEYCKR